MFHDYSLHRHRQSISFRWNWKWVKLKSFNCIGAVRIRYFNNAMFSHPVSRICNAKKFSESLTFSTKTRFTNYSKQHSLPSNRIEQVRNGYLLYSHAKRKWHAKLRKENATTTNRNGNYLFWRSISLVATCNCSDCRMYWLFLLTTTWMRLFGKTVFCHFWATTLLWSPLIRNTRTHANCREYALTLPTL